MLRIVKCVGHNLAVDFTIISILVLIKHTCSAACIDFLYLDYLFYPHLFSSYYSIRKTAFLNNFDRLLA